MAKFFTVFIVTALSFSWPMAALAQQGAQPSVFLQMVPFLFMIGIFYFLLIRPQAQRAKKHSEFLKSLKRGDRVLTNGGMFGTVEGLNEKFVTLEIANGVRVRLLRSYVAQSIQEVSS